MKFSQLSFYLQKLEKTASRNEITKILAEFFKKIDKNEVNKATYLLLGRIAPNYENLVFNIAERMMLDVISLAYKVEKEEVKRQYKKEGDLGEVAFGFYSGKDTKPSISQIFDRLVEVAKDEGEGTQERKINKMANILSSVDKLSAKYLARIPVGRLRLGFSDKTVLDALSWMVNKDKSAKKELDSAYCVLPDVGSLAQAVKKEGIAEATKNVKPQVGVPILSMLAQRLNSPVEMIKKMNEVAIEPKFDGLRIQIHFKAGKRGFVKAFTRNLNETSWMFPELQKIGSQLNVKKDVILDSEAIGVDEERKSLANFQATMTRRRKHEIEKTASKVPIKFFVFDILLVDGKGLIDETYLKRRKLLEKVVNEGKILEVVGSVITQSPEEIEKQVEKELGIGMEGIMLKKVGSKYVSGRAGWRWVKMKEEAGSKAKLADTIDCIVMGYTRGRGKRTQFGIGQFLAGIVDKGKFKTITKVGTGLSDEQFREMSKRLSKIQTDKKPKEYEVHKDLEPDFWVLPQVVVELTADEITKSPKHTAGLALRFPRLVKFRDDKESNDATSLNEVKKLYKLQK